jgi:hypothetical protein
VLDTLTEKDFQEVSQKWDGGTSVYMQEELLVVANRPCGKFYDFFTASVWNILDTPLYVQYMIMQTVFAQQVYHSPIRMNHTKNYECQSFTFLLH